jgi:hypothetical protein
LKQDNNGIPSYGYSETGFQDVHQRYDSAGAPSGLIDGSRWNNMVRLTAEEAFLNVETYGAYISLNASR